MESYRTVRMLAAIKEHMENGRPQEAFGLILQLNRKKVKNVQDLNMMAQVCQRVGRLDEAKEITLQIYEKTSSRRALAQLVELSIKLGQPEEAEAFLERYEAVAASDPTRLIYRFRILKMLQEPIEEQIVVLEQWKTEEYAERWAYELAKLYHKAGDADRCVKECNDIILWFGEGKYVEWASVLRAYHTGEVDMETLHSYQETIADDMKQESDDSAVGNENVSEEESPVVADVVYEDEAVDETVEEATEEEQPVEESLTEETSEMFAEEVPQAEEVFDDIAVSAALASAAEEFSKEEPERLLNTGIVTEETREVFEEEAIRYMQDYLGDLSTKHVVDMRGEGKSKYQPEEGGALEAMLYERELRLEDLFGNFARMEPVRKQIVRALDIIFDPHKKGDNLIITGGHLSGKTELAKKLVKMLYRFQVLSATRVAIVNADKLNRMDLEEKQNSLLDCCLIIENADLLTTETVERLLGLIAKFSGRSIVFLEGERKAINGLLRDNAELNRVFNNRIHLPEEYRSAELKGFVFDYLMEKDYEIDVYADEVLEKRIQMLLRGKCENPIRDSIAIGKEGIKNAEKRAAKNLTRMAATGNYENADIMVLHKEDFI